MKVILVFLFAFLIRFINLGQSLWLDETIVAKVVKTIPFHLIPIQLSPGDVHPPLYYMVISLWTSVFGTSEIALRFPSIIFSLIAGWFVYKAGLHLRNKKTAFWAATFFLFNPLIIYYSQEARMHMMATAFLSMALYYFLVLIKESQNLKFKNILLFNLFSVLAMFTFYGSAFFIAGMIISGFFIRPKRRDLVGRGFYLFIGLFISLLILSPLLYLQMISAENGLAELKNWSMALGKAEIKNVLMIFLKFATGRLSWYPKWSYYLAAGIPTAITWLVVALGMKKNKLLAFLFMFPLFVGLMISFIAPMMMYFRFLYLIPVMSLLLALGVTMRRLHIEYGIAMLFFVFSFVYLCNPLFHRENWKELTGELGRQTRVYMILPSSDPVAYYRNDILIFELRNIKKESVPEYITIIPYTSDLYGFNYSQALQEKGCVKKSQMSFRGNLLLEEWTCLSNG
jgi:uncharacterized membrane protein